MSARLIVRRVKRLNPRQEGSEQGGLLDAYRHHAVFTDSPLGMLDAEASHRDHAIIEQVIADLKAGPLAHCPSGVFTGAQRQDGAAGRRSTSPALLGCWPRASTPMPGGPPSSLT